MYPCVVNRVCGHNKITMYRQQGKQTPNFDIVICFLIHSIFAIFLFLYDLLV